MRRGRAGLISLAAPTVFDRLVLAPTPAQEDSPIEARDLTFLLADATLEKKAIEPVILDVQGKASYADFFVICSGGSTRQVQAISEWVEKRARDAGVHVISVEGLTSGKWVLLDFGAVVVHVFYEPVRAFYDLEGLWADARQVPVPDKAGPIAASQA